MRADLAARLASLPALNPKNAELQTPRCKVCGSVSRIFDVVDFNKCGGDKYNFYRYGFSGVSVYYYRCIHCRFIFTDFYDDWTHQDFSSFVYNADYSKIDPEYATIRPQRCAEQLAMKLRGAEDEAILDYGSGAGIFAEALRAAGYANCVNFDPFSSPERPSGRFEIITCFEVMEHTPKPIDTLKNIASYLQDGGCVIFSTGLQPPEVEFQKANWWYVSPRNGHVSIHSAQSLALLAKTSGMEFCPGSFGFAAMRRIKPAAGWNNIAKKCQPAAPEGRAANQSRFAERPTLS